MTYSSNVNTARVNLLLFIVSEQLGSFIVTSDLSSNLLAQGFLEE